MSNFTEKKKTMTQHSTALQHNQTTCYLYILQGTKDFHYCGITIQPHKRLQQHNSKQSTSTKRNTPLILRYITECATRKTARHKEKMFKNFGVKKTLHKLRLNNQLHFSTTLITYLGLQKYTTANSQQPTAKYTTTLRD